jgi:phosphoglycolate phosphatase-like HAD superfamily hydrolase
MKKSFLIFTLLISILSACKNRDIETGNQPEVKVKTPLPSWNDGKVKSSILEFIIASTDSTKDTFIPLENRIATFDNDGTLWPENPLYFQLLYAIDYIKKAAIAKPELKKQEPFSSILENDIDKVMAGGHSSLIQIINYSHAKMTVEEFEFSVKEWLNSSLHPKFGKPYHELVYLPMLELMDLLRDHGFKIFIVSGGGIDFMRVWATEAYGIPSHQIIGSSLKTKYEYDDSGNPILRKEAAVNFIDDAAGKPVAIHHHIGKRPVFAAGNSDGDYEMLEYTSAHPTGGLSIIIHHTDSLREFAYDKNSKVGRLDRGINDAEKKGWILIDMAADWKKVF